MPCPSTVYGGGRDNDRHWHNWLGNISYLVPGYFQPSSRQDLVWILQQAETQGKKLEAVGSGWSFEDCAVSEDHRQASSLETTSPSTSVRRKSLPMWR